MNNPHCARNAISFGEQRRCDLQVGYPGRRVVQLWHAQVEPAATLPVDPKAAIAPIGEQVSKAPEVDVVAIQPGLDAHDRRLPEQHHRRGRLTAPEAVGRQSAYLH